MPRTLFFSFCEKRKSASCFLVGGDVVLKKEKFFAVCGLKFEWSSNGERKQKRLLSLSLSLFIEEGNSVCLSALSQGSLCPLLRANTRIFAREERERGRERERRRRKSERERRESEREREIYSPALVCGCGFRFLRSKKEREEEEEEEEEGL
jgi:hypothetical protein